jgi:hypothetical protein
METRLTLRPGMPGTKKLVARYGDRLVCVRYLYDETRAASENGGTGDRRDAMTRSRKKAAAKRP